MAANEKMNISFTIKAIDRFSKPMEKLDRKLDELKKSAQRLDAIQPNVEVDANVAGAIARIDAIERKLNDLPGKKTINVRVKKYGFSALANSLETVNTISRSMASGGIFTALPMLSPILASAAGGAGALAGALVSAGTGAGLFATVAIPALTGIFKAQEKVKGIQEKIKNAANAKERATAVAELEGVYASLSNTQKKTLGNMKSFAAFFSKFAKQFEKPILGAFNKSMGIAKSLLLKMQPAIGAMAKTVNELMNAFSRNIESEDMKAFFNWINTTAAPNFAKLVKTVGNFFAGFANMMVAFQPLTTAFMDGFLNMSESFRKWTAALTENKAFQDFMAYVKEQGPQVLALIGNLAKFLVQLAIAFAPLGEVILKMTNSFLKWATQLLKNNKVVAFLVGLLPVLIGAFKILWPIVVTVISVFKKLVPMVAKAWGVLGKFWKVIAKAIPWVIRIGSKLKWLMGPVGLVIGIIVELAIVIYKNWDSIKKWTIETFNKVATYISEKWADIQTAFAIAKEIVKTAISKFVEFKNKITEKMNDVWDNITEIWDDVMGFFEDINLLKTGEDIMQGLINGIGNMAGAITKKIKEVAGGIKDDLMFWTDSNSPSRMSEKIGGYVGQGLVVGIDDKIKAIQQASKRMASASIPSMPPMPSVSQGAYDGNKVDRRSQREGYYRSQAAPPAAPAAQNKYTVEVPVYLDSREIARSTVDDISEIIQRRTQTELRAQGIS